ncbi:MAG: class I SAM-dependent methyltransferase, partial [Planctomycetota bacterium]|nr:class I SAM-dependent methyltransferase [Planctomycetota bacterium]
MRFTDPDELLAMDLASAEGDWRPTPHGEHLARTLAENNLVQGKRVLELGGGVANHTILLLRQGAAHVVTTEIVASRSETTRANVERNCPGATNIEYRLADWLSTPDRFDVVITNPPFAKSGKQNR